MLSPAEVDLYVVPNRRHPGDPAHATLRGTGIPVFAVIGHAREVGGDAGFVAEDYEVPREAVEAAFAYYAAHRDPIDALLHHAHR